MWVPFFNNDLENQSEITDAAPVNNWFLENVDGTVMAQNVLPDIFVHETALNKLSVRLI